MSQNKKLLSYLKDNGSIDPMQSLNELGIYRLSARIYDLRLQGHLIETQSGLRHAIYRLKKEK